jgi:hypothetical protein
MAATARSELSSRPYQVSVARDVTTSPEALYRAWTGGFDVWFAAPGSVLMRGAVDEIFFFQTQFEDARHPHYDGTLVAITETGWPETTPACRARWVKRRAGPTSSAA